MIHSSRRSRREQVHAGACPGAPRPRRGPGQPRDSCRRRREPLRRPDRGHEDRSSGCGDRQGSALQGARRRARSAQPRMRRVLALRFGLDGHHPQTLEQVGVGLGITRERVRQLESRAARGATSRRGCSVPRRNLGKSTANRRAAVSALRPENPLLGKSRSGTRFPLVEEGETGTCPAVVDPMPARKPRFTAALSGSPVLTTRIRVLGLLRFEVLRRDARRGRQARFCRGQAATRIATTTGLFQRAPAVASRATAASCSRSRRAHARGTRDRPPTSPVRATRTRARALQPSPTEHKPTVGRIHSLFGARRRSEGAT